MLLLQALFGVRNPLAGYSVHMQRPQLVEYLCRQQHAVFLEAALIEGVDAVGPWEDLPERNRLILRTTMDNVLKELEALGLLRLPAPV